MLQTGKPKYLIVLEVRLEACDGPGTHVEETSESEHLANCSRNLNSDFRRIVKDLLLHRKQTNPGSSRSPSLLVCCAGYPARSERYSGRATIPQRRTRLATT